MTTQPDTESGPVHLALPSATERMALLEKVVNHTRLYGPTYKALQLETGEQVLSISVTDTQAIVLFHQRYGTAKQRGKRLLVLADNGSEWEVVVTTFTPDIEPGSTPDYVDPENRRARADRERPRTSGVAGPATRPIPEYITRLGTGAPKRGSIDSNHVRHVVTYEVIDRVTGKCMATTESFSFACELGNQYEWAVDHVENFRRREIIKQPLIPRKGA